MTTTQLRRLLLERYEDEAIRIATENGRAKARTIKEYRFQAGIVAGLELAAGMLEDAIKHAEDETNL